MNFSFDVGYKQIDIKDPQCKVWYNKSKKICVVLPDFCKDINELAKHEKFDKDLVIWTAIPMKDSNFIVTLQNLIRKGYNEPYVTEEAPNKKDIPISVAMIKETNSRDEDEVSVLNKVYYAIKEYKENKGYCTMVVRLTPEAVEFLKQMSHQGHTKNKNGKISQKELTGDLYIKNVDTDNDIMREFVNDENGNFVYNIDVKKNTIQSGEEENIDVPMTRYNFHSHPKEAYIRHSVKLAWPSVTDFLGFFHLGNNTIFHCVVTLEGIYIIFFGSYWVRHLNDDKKGIKKFIKENLDYSKKRTDVLSPYEYCKEVNNKRYTGHNIFHVKYIPWEYADTTTFKVIFSQNGQGCMTTQKMLDFYKKN